VSRAGRIGVAASLAAVVIAAAAPTTARAGCACGEWRDLPAVFNLCFKQTGSGCADSPWHPFAQSPLAEWNVFVDLWRIAASPIDTFANGDSIHSAGWMSYAAMRERFGFEPDGDVLGVTFGPGSASHGGGLSCPLPALDDCLYFDADYDIDVALVSDHRWSTDELAVHRNHASGSRDLFHFGNVLDHEYGHALGAMHESRYPAIMHPSSQPLRGMALTGDDVYLARTHYPGIATGVSDLAVSAYRFVDGVYHDAFVFAGTTSGAAGLEAGDFTVFNRGTEVREVALILTVDGVEAWRASCSLGAYQYCDADLVTVELPPWFEAWDAEVAVAVEGGAEVLTYDNWIPLGQVTIEPIDRDGDGFSPDGGGDCDDGDEHVNPATQEVCNGVDDDCDGGVDTGRTGAPLSELCYDGPPATDGVGRCRGGQRTCHEGSFGACEGQATPRAETCDGRDHDCDGDVDEGCDEPVEPGPGEPVEPGPDPSEPAPPRGGDAGGVEVRVSQGASGGCASGAELAGALWSLSLLAVVVWLSRRRTRGG